MPPEAESPEPQPKRVSVVIVTIDRAETLRANLQALGTEHQILIVDNGSTDSTPALTAEFPEARFIRLPRNFGLTKALNIGIRAADGSYVLLLHDDARISGEAVSRLAGFLEQRQDVAAVCPLLLHASVRAPQVRALPTPSQPDPRLGPAAGEGEIQAECVSGAAILFRTSFLRNMRQIDEHYGTYGNIVELCSQVRRAGRKLVILSEVTAEHEALDSPVRKSLLEGDRVAGTAVFLAKHYGLPSGLLYRGKQALAGLFTFRFKSVAGALTGARIDGA